jgi:hypothetical protein
MVMAGQYVVINNATSMARKNGIMLLVTAAIEVLPTLHPTNRHVPTGGVHNPIHRLATIMTPN